MKLTSARARQRVSITTAVVLVALGAVDCSSLSRESLDAGTLGALANPTRHAATREQILTSASGTYIGRLLADRDSVLDRWVDRVDEPIRVAIDAPDVAQSAAFIASVRAAFHVWESAGIPVRFH